MKNIARICFALYFGFIIGGAISDLGETATVTYSWTTPIVLGVVLFICFVLGILSANTTKNNL